MNKKGKIAVAIGAVAGVISGFVLGKYWERLATKIGCKLLGLGGPCDPFDYEDFGGNDFDDYDDYDGCGFEDYDEDEEYQYPPIPEVDADELDGKGTEDFGGNTEEEKNRH